MQDNGWVKFTWSKVSAPDLAGYVFARSDVDPKDHKGKYIQLAGKAATEDEKIKEGDMIIADVVIRELDRSKRAVRVGDHWRSNVKLLPDLIPGDFYPDAAPDKHWRLVNHQTDTAVENPGETYLEMTLPAGDEEKMGGYKLGSTGQTWYHVLNPEKEYTVQIWLKADRDDAPPVVFESSGNAGGGDPIPTMQFQPTTEWQKFSKTVKVKSVEKGLGQIHFVFKGPATYSIDNIRVYRADTEYLDYFPKDYGRLKRSGMSAFRTHGPIKTGTNTYSMEQFTNTAGLVNGIGMGNTLPQMFKMMEKADIDPWLQIEFHMTPEEWLGFVEYIAAPYDPAKDSPESKPWACKRYKQGRKEPWIDAFRKVYFEISNETWNWLFQPWVFEGMPDVGTGEKVGRGNVYGMMNEHIIEIFRSSPYWNDEIEKKFVYMIGGCSRSTYGWDAVDSSPSADFQLIAAYNGGWDEGEGPAKPTPPSFFNILGQVYQSALPTAQLNAERLIERRKTNPELRLGTYEAGPGYALNGLNNAKVTREQAREQEEAMKSKVGGTATLDTFLMRCMYDFDSQNFFTFGEGSTWSSHTRWYRGGQAYPCFLTLEMFNNHGLGDMLNVRTESVATVDTPKHRRRKAIKNAPLATVYATRDGSRVNVFCISRRFPGYPEESDDGYSPMTLKLPFSKAQKVTLYRMTGEPHENNIYEEKIKLETLGIGEDMSGLGTFVINEKTGGTDRGLPPAETYLYVFEGTDIGAEGKKIGLEDIMKMPYTFNAE